MFLYDITAYLGIGVDKSAAKRMVTAAIRSADLQETREDQGVDMGAKGEKNVGTIENRSHPAPKKRKISKQKGN
jgi:hypothetical protein